MVTQKGKRRFYWVSTEKNAPKRVEFNKTWVPSFNPQSRAAHVERIFEEVRREVNPTAPSRLSCASVRDEMSDSCFCPSTGFEILAGTYEVELQGDYAVFKADYSHLLDAFFAGGNKSQIRRSAELYWKGNKSKDAVIETLVSPPESAIIVGRL